MIGERGGLGTTAFATLALRTRAVVLVVAALILNINCPAARAGEEVDALLVLAADTSYSIDAPKFELQRQGYARAIANPRVVNAILSGASRRIAACFVEWSGVTWQDLVIDWTLIGEAESAHRFGQRILQAPRSFPERTSISAAIDFATAQIERAPFRSGRRIIDLSGDGDNNAGRSATSARDEAVAKGITINGLAILSDDPREHTNPTGGLRDYYSRNVIGGPGAFVMVSEGFDSFGRVLVKKLVTEIASAPHLQHATAR
jgi:hypothetical protein